MPTRNPTVSDLAKSMAGVDKRTQALVGAVESMQQVNSEEFDKIWVTLGGITGMGGLGGGLSQVAASLEPLRALVPPTTGTALDPGVPEALAAIRAALGESRPADVGVLTTPYDAAVGFIGQPVDPDYTTDARGQSA